MIGLTERVQQREISLATVQHWIDRGYIRAVRLPNGYEEWPAVEVTRLLTRMFEVPAQLDEALIELAPRRRGRAVRPDEWGPAF